MGAEPLRLDDVIESIADGTPLEWDVLEAGTADAAQRRLLRHLRIVAGIADVHRTLNDEREPSETDQPGDLPTFAGPVKRWGHLLLLEKLGEGSYGDVYRARDPWLDREVALKLLRAAPGERVPVSRVLHEGRTLARVRHPNVVTVLGADVHEGRVGLWMEFVPGPTLEEQLTRGGTFSVADAISTGRALCGALAAVHAAGLVHRDIKTQNVIREPDGRLVLMDFGAGQIADRPRAAGSRPAGTPLYLAPEVLNGSAATVQSDIYALGVLLYRLVTSEFPMSAATIDELTAAHARAERRLLRDARADLPEAFTAVIERALDPDPSRRFESADQLGAALDGAVSVAPSDDGTKRDERYTQRITIWTFMIALAVALTIVGVWLWSRGPRQAKSGSDIPIVAVMPLSGDSSTSPDFADGITESLVQELAGTPSLRVVSRTSVSAARQVARGATDIARRLHADAVLEGSVSRSPAANVRMRLRLTRAGTDVSAWAKTFERPLHAVFELQRDAVNAVIEELDVAPGERSQRSRRRVDPAAHDAYLQGRARLQADGPANHMNALEQFRAAVKLDPGHALAHAAMARAFFLLGSVVLAREEAFKLASEAAVRALGLDDELPDAHVVRAEVRFQRDWDWQGAESSFRRALQLNPSHEYAHERYAMFLAARDRCDEALARLTQAERIDPLSPVIASTRAAILRYARRYPEAVTQYRAVLRDHPTHVSAQVGLARTLSAMGRHDEAIAQYRSLTLRPHDWFVLGEIAQAEAAVGRADAARAILDQIRRSEADLGWVVGPDTYAYVLGKLADLDGAFAALDDGFRVRASGVLWLKVDARADSLRNDPRFKTYLERLGFAP